jgi:phosphoribosylglycinamide formyltransferase 2
VIYAGMDGQNLQFSGLEQALAVAGSDLRLFGKPEGFSRRRMGVATVRAKDTDTARTLAKQAADAVKVSG